MNGRIAPQTNDGSWDGEIYDESDVIHTLGNLTLLPAVENSLLGNESWDLKKKIFEIFSTKTEDDFNQKRQEAEEAGVQFTARRAEVIAASKYLLMTSSIAVCEDVWDRKLIEDRAENIAGLSWDFLGGWLHVE